MPNTTYGTPYAQSSDLVSNWPGLSLNVADRLDDVSFKGNGLNDQTGTTYTLVLTDAGKTVTLNNASAVTVTVPTNASVAYETGTVINLVNKGAGTVTVTAAGGVTLNSAISLAQNISASIRKLDTNTWVMNTAPKAFTQIASGTLSGASLVLSSIPNTYRDLRLVLLNALPATNATDLYLRLNGDSTANRYASDALTSAGPLAFTGAQMVFTTLSNSTSSMMGVINVPEYANATTWKFLTMDTVFNDTTTTTQFKYRRFYGLYNQTAAISSITLLMSSGNFTSGNYYLYGVQ
jgi:hypothetical protein